jgi:hypothetical protein
MAPGRSVTQPWVLVEVSFLTFYKKRVLDQNKSEDYFVQHMNITIIYN